MLQRSNYTLTLSFDIVQNLPDTTTHAETLAQLNEAKTAIEFSAFRAIKINGDDFGLDGVTVEVTKMPSIK